MSVNIFENGQLKRIAGGGIVDDVLSKTSIHPVQNRVVTEAIDELNEEIENNKIKFTDITVDIADYEPGKIIYVEYSTGLLQGRWAHVIGSLVCASTPNTSAFPWFFVNVSYNRIAITNTYTSSLRTGLTIRIFYY